MIDITDMQRHKLDLAQESLKIDLYDSMAEANRVMLELDLMDSLDLSTAEGRAYHLGYMTGKLAAINSIQDRQIYITELETSFRARA